MNQAFVGQRSVASSAELKQLLAGLPAQSRCYFLRWVHKVSGFGYEMPPEFPSPEGEMLTPEFEVRWKQRKQIGQGYEVLLLHSGEPDASWNFQPIGQDWMASDPLDTHLHPKGSLEENAENRQDTRFPKPFIYPNHLKLQQRYFQNQHTGTVHFVALTLVPLKVNAA
jgi:hypothetical protein